MRLWLGLVLRIVFSGLVAVAAGFVAFALLGYQPLWTHEAPSGSFVVGWSPRGKYVLTWVPSENVLELRQAENGEVANRLKLRAFDRDSPYFEMAVAQGFPFFSC